jgi:hypothetical protein
MLPLLGIVEQLVKLGVSMFLKTWSRCSETTADRAGLICCGDLHTAQLALAKLTTGGGPRLADINLDEYIRQLEMVNNSPLKLVELTEEHPLIPRRLAALRLFADCVVLNNWRPEMPRLAEPRSKEETDRLCAEVIGVLRDGKLPDEVFQGVGEDAP